jgi:predicted Zn-dependent peptidase
MGALPEDFAAALLALLERLPPRREQPVPPPAAPAPRALRRTTETAAMQQSRLVLTLRCPPPATPAALCALHALVSLWGGGPHSRLFREVRERRSLAYAVGAGADVHKGIVSVQAGLDASAAEAAEAEILAQLAALQSGSFRDDELVTALATITGPLQAVDDSLAARMQFTGEQWVRGFDQTPAERLCQYVGVDRDAVLGAAAGIWLDHVYLLQSEGASGGTPG